MASEQDINKHYFEKMPVLSDDRLVLKEIEYHEVAAIIEISVYDGTFAKSKAEAIHMLEKINLDVANGEALHWGIFIKNTGDLVGTCGYYRGVANHSGEIGYILRPSYYGLGIMTQAVNLIANFGFDILKLQSVIAYTDPANSASIAVLQRVGFTKVRNEGSDLKFEKLHPQRWYSREKTSLVQTTQHSVKWTGGYVVRFHTFFTVSAVGPRPAHQRLIRAAGQPKDNHMTYPILEYDDSTSDAFIEPSKVIRPRDMPEHCVICFFKEVLDQVIEKHNAKMLVENRWEDGAHPVYEIEHHGKRLAFYHPGIGASLSASILEEVIAFGCKKFIACGGSGVLAKDIAVGNLVVVSGAIRDEGVSYHYLPPDREIIANTKGINALVSELEKRGMPYRRGKTWTTDAPYRETPNKVAKRKDEGCLTVEMECAGMMAVAQFRDVIYGQVLYGGDDLSGTTWDSRGWQSRKEVRESLFWLCADVCLAL